MPLSVSSSEICARHDFRIIGNLQGSVQICVGMDDDIMAETHPRTDVRIAGIYQRHAFVLILSCRVCDASASALQSLMPCTSFQSSDLTAMTFLPRPLRISTRSVR